MDAAKEAVASQNELVAAYTDFARKIVWGYIDRNDKLNFSDLEAAAIRGLWKATKKFDPAKGRFTTIAAFWVKAEIRRQLKQERPIKAIRSGKPEDDGERSDITDVLEDRNATQPIEASQTTFDGETVRSLIADCLNEHEAAVVSAVFGLDGVETTLAGAAERLGLCRERGRQLYEAGMAKLRRRLVA